MVHLADVTETKLYISENIEQFTSLKFSLLQMYSQISSVKY